MQRFVSGPDVWPTLTTMLAAGRHRRVAIAYVTADALLPLKRGDRLVVDASPDKIASGATDPRILLRWLEKEVKVWSHPDVHAKVIVTDGKVAVGSANASANSAGRLREAVLVSDDPAVRAEAVRFVDDLIEQAGPPLTSAYLELWAPLFGTEKPRGRSTRWTSIVPRPVTRLQFLATTGAAEVPTGVRQTQIEVERRTPVADRFTLEWFECARSDEFYKGDLVCQVWQGVGIWAPQQVVYILKPPRQRRAWLALLTDREPRTTSSAAIAASTGLRARTGIWIHDPVQLAAILRHWKLSAT